MRFRCICALATVLCASSAGAKTQTTPAVHVDTGLAALCVVQNLSTKTVSVGVDLFRSDGTLMLTTGTQSEPGSIDEPAGVDTEVDDVYCSFDGLTKSVRGYIALRQGTATLVVLPAEK